MEGMRLSALVITCGLLTVCRNRTVQPGGPLIVLGEPTSSTGCIERIAIEAPNAVTPPGCIYEIGRVEGVPACERIAKMMQYSRKHEGHQKIGDKKDEA